MLTDPTKAAEEAGNPERKELRAKKKSDTGKKEELGD